MEDDWHCFLRLWHYGKLLSHEAECIALLWQALEWLTDISEELVLLLIDMECQLVVHSDINEFGVIINKCRSILNSRKKNI